MPSQWSAATALPDTRSGAPQDARPIWLFGYGSLIFKADFPFRQRRPAAIRGWARRFWQGSHDHRGSAQAPGRVLTLVAAPGALCGGIAYLIAPQAFAQLDEREQDGYRRSATTIEFGDGSRAAGLVYYADAGNPAWLGPASSQCIARQINRAVGASGRNRDYLLALAQALRTLGQHDAHVFELEACVRALPAPVA